MLNEICKCLSKHMIVFDCNQEYYQFLVQINNRKLTNHPVKWINPIRMRIILLKQPLQLQHKNNKWNNKYTG